MKEFLRPIQERRKFYEENPDYGIDYNELVKTTTNSYVTFVDLYSEVLGNLDTSMTRHVNQYDTEPEYVYMTYVKGMLLFDNLRGVIGKNKLIQGLQHYYKTNAFKNVNHDYLIDSMEKSSRTELGNYFKAVHYADSAIRDFVSALDENGLLENTVLVI